jgi:uncharacterized protein (TIGR02588 family)
VEHSADQSVVHDEVTNQGGVTAEGVHVLGTVTAGGRVVEEVSSTIGYVPARSTRRGALVFTVDPDTGQLEVRAASYTVP